MIENNINWIFFSVILALLPILLNFTIVKLSNIRNIGWVELLKDGELFFFSTATSASSIGTLVLNRPPNIALTILIGSLLVIILIMSSCLFSLSSFLKLKQMDVLDKRMFGVISIWCSFFAVALSYYVLFVMGVTK